MKKVGLSVYGLNVQDQDDQRKSLKKVTDNKSFIDIVEEFANNNDKEFNIDKQAENAFKFEKIEKKEELDANGKLMFSTIWGLVKTGEYGTESELVDIESGKIAYKRKQNHADVIPFAFYVAIPMGEQSRGIVILQTEGRFGMKIAFEKRLRAYISSIKIGWKFSMGNIMPKEYIERYLVKGCLNEIRMIKYGIPNDISERYGINQEPKVYEERIIHNPYGFATKGYDAIRDVLKGQRLFTSIIEIKDFDYDKLKFNFKLGNTNKTIDMTNLDCLVVTEDITEQVGVKKGHPEFRPLISIMKETAIEYLKGMGLL